MWIKRFLERRKQQVFINETNSEWTDVSSGIPQGSVLGPLLFVIFVNDFPEIVKSDMHVFADDIKIFKIIKKQQG